MFSAFLHHSLQREKEKVEALELELEGARGDFKVNIAHESLLAHNIHV